MEKNLVGRKHSDVNSHLSVFENHNWKSMSSQLSIRPGQYFAAGVLVYEQRKLTMLKPDIYVLDYRPMNDELDTGYRMRSYAKAWSSKSASSTETGVKDVVFSESALYKCISDSTFELVLKNKEWQKAKKAKAFIKGIVKDLGYCLFPEDAGKKKDIQKRLFECNSSVGYFLKGRSYEVFSMVVGKELPLGGYEKKIIFLDYETGIPGDLDIAFGTQFKKI